MKKIETIVNMSLSRTSRDSIRFSVEDEHSSDRILEICMTPKEFALLVTGLSGIKGTAEIFPEANIAKKREVKRATCEKTSYTSKQDQKDLVQEHFENNILPLHEGWEIKDDGTTSQQRGKEHEYILKRYVPVEDVYDVERYY